jgi:hypothetical protein
MGPGSSPRGVFGCIYQGSTVAGPDTKVESAKGKSHDEVDLDGKNVVPGIVRYGRLCNHTPRIRILKITHRTLTAPFQIEHSNSTWFQVRPFHYNLLVSSYHRR